MAAPQAPASRGRIAPSLKRVVAQQYKSYNPQVADFEDGQVWQAIRAEFPEYPEDAVASAIFEELKMQPAFGAAAVMPEAVVKAPPEKPQGALDYLNQFLVQPIAEQVKSVTQDLPSGLSKLPEAFGALQGAVPPAFAADFGQAVSPEEAALREEEAKGAVGSAALKTAGGAAPLISIGAGATVARGLAALGRGAIMRSAMATGTDLGTYNFLTALAEGKPAAQAAGEGMVGFGTGATLGAAGRAVARRVGRRFSRGAVQEISEGLPGSTPTRTGADLVLEKQAERLMVDHPAEMRALGAGAATPEETAQAIMAKLDVTDPEAIGALRTRLEQNLPGIIARAQRDVAVDVTLGAQAAPELLRLEAGAIPMGPLTPEASVLGRVARRELPTEAPPQRPLLPAETGRPGELPLHGGAEGPQATVLERVRGGMRQVGDIQSERLLRKPRPVALSEAAEQSRVRPIQETLGLHMPERSLIGQQASDGRGNVIQILAQRGPGRYEIQRADGTRALVNRFDIYLGPPGSATKKLLDLADEAKARIDARRARLGAGQDIFADLSDHVAWAALTMARYGTHREAMRAVRRELVAQFGPAIKSKLDEIITKAQKQAEIVLRNMTKGEKYPSLERLLDLVKKGNFGGEWYEPSRRELVQKFGEADADMVLRFIAATSPRTEVRDNINRAMTAFVEWKLGMPFSNELKAHRDNLYRAIRNEALSGPKVEPFYRAMTGDPNAIVIDTWMMKAFGFRGDTPNLTQIRIMDRDIQQIAKRRGLTPAQAQERIWKGIKAEVEGARAEVRGPAELIEARMKGRTPAAFVKAETKRVTSLKAQNDLVEQGLAAVRNPETVDSGHTFNLDDFTPYEGGGKIVSVLSLNEPIEQITRAKIRAMKRLAAPLLKEFGPEQFKLGVFQLSREGVPLTDDAGRALASVDLNVVVPDRQTAVRVGAKTDQLMGWDADAGELFDILPGAAQPVVPKSPKAKIDFIKGRVAHAAKVMREEREPTLFGVEQVGPAAIRVGDQIFTGPNHRAAAKRAHTSGVSMTMGANAEPGFVTSTGRFVSLEEANKLAVAAGQKKLNMPKIKGAEGRLVSEEIRKASGEAF